DERHVPGVLDLLSDPAVSDPIYDMPRPFTAESVGGWIAECAELRRKGDGLLILTVAPDGLVWGYSKITVWPQHSSAELGGALRARGHTGGGGRGRPPPAGGLFLGGGGLPLSCPPGGVEKPPPPPPHRPRGLRPRGRAHHPPPRRHHPPLYLLGADARAVE